MMDLAAERSSMPFLAASMASAKLFSRSIPAGAFSMRRVSRSSWSRKAVGALVVGPLLKFQLLDLGG